MQSFGTFSQNATLGIIFLSKQLLVVTRDRGQVEETKYSFLAVL